MKRLLLYPLAAVLVLAGEPAVGATLDLPPAPRAVGTGWITAPIQWFLSTLTPASPDPGSPDTAEPSPEPSLAD